MVAMMLWISRNRNSFLTLRSTSLQHRSAMLVVLTFPSHARQAPVRPLAGPGSEHRPHTKRHTELQIMQRQREIYGPRTETHTQTCRSHTEAHTNQTQRDTHRNTDHTQRDTHRNVDCTQRHTQKYRPHTEIQTMHEDTH